MYDMGIGAALQGVGGVVGALTARDRTADMESSAKNFNNNILPSVDLAFGKSRKNAFGKMGDQAAIDAKTYDDMYNGRIDASQQSAINDVRNNANSLLSQISANNEAANSNAQRQDRDNLNAINSMANKMQAGPGALSAMARGLGDASAKNNAALNVQQNQGVSSAINGAADLNAKAGNMEQAAKQEAYQRNVAPHLVQSSDYSQLMNSVGNQISNDAALLAKPSWGEGIAAALGSAGKTSMGSNAYAGTNSGEGYSIFGLNLSGGK